MTYYFKKYVERPTEWLLWHSRRAIFIAVIACLSAYFAILLMASVDILKLAAPVFSEYFFRDDEGREVLHQVTLKGVVGIIDSFLVAIVLLIFSLGLYELFVSEIDIAHGRKRHSVGEHSVVGFLRIENLDDLKSSLIKVVVVILIVTLFENAVAMKLETPVDLVYYGLGTVLVALAMLVIYYAERQLHQTAGRSDVEPTPHPRTKIDCSSSDLI